MSTPDRLRETVEFYSATPTVDVQEDQTAQFLRDEIQRHNDEREPRTQDV